MLDPENLPRGELEAEPERPPEVPLQLVRPAERARFKPDNFTCETVVAADSLTVELLCLGPGGDIPAHRHEETEHVLTVLSGRASVRVGERRIEIGEGESVVAPAGLYHGITNATGERLIVQQVSAPKPWDARFSGAHPSAHARR